MPVREMWYNQLEFKPPLEANEKSLAYWNSSPLREGGIRAVETAQNDSVSLWVFFILSWKQRFVGLNVLMVIFRRLATRWLSRIEEDYSRSQVGSYLAHAADLCPEEGIVLGLGLRFVMLKTIQRKAG